MAKYEEKDRVRKDLLELALAIYLANEDSEKINYSDKFFDVTGSMGCWGIVNEK